MGKASSAKKVRAAARAGGGRSGQRRSFIWPALIGGLVVLGLVLVVVSLDGDDDDDVGPVLLTDHWHAAFGIYNCQGFTAPLTDQLGDEFGLHSHGDGLIHMHPTSSSASGTRATLGRWGDEVGLDVSEDSIEVEYLGVDLENGDECGDEEAVVQLKVWSGPGDDEGRIVEGDPADYRPQDGEIITLAFVPDGADIPKPPSAGNLADPTAAEEGRPVPVPQDSTPTTPAPATPAPPAEGDADTTTSTTAAG